MKRKILAVIIALILLLSIAVSVYAGPNGGTMPPPIPPIPTSIGLYVTALPQDPCETPDSCEYDCLLPCVCI